MPMPSASERLSLLLFFFFALRRMSNPSLGTRKLTPEESRGSAPLRGMQPCHQFIDAGGDAFPVVQPGARKTYRDIRFADPPFQKASARTRDTAQCAAREKMLRRGRFEDQFLALIRSAVA